MLDAITNEVPEGDRVQQGLASREVLMLPDYRDGNPYQELLARGLEAEGWRVVFPVGYRRVLPVFRQCWTHREARVVHLHWPEPFLQRGKTAWQRRFFGFKLLLDLWLVRLTGRRLVWTIHNLQGHESRLPEFDRWVARQICRVAHARLVHSPRIAAAVAEAWRLGPVRVAWGLGMEPESGDRSDSAQSGEKQRAALTVIPHGELRSFYGEPPPREAARAQLGWSAGEQVWLAFGFVRPYKGLELLLEAWEGHRVRFPESRLVIAGEARDPAYGAELAARSAKLGGVECRLGRVLDGEVAALLSAADALCAPFAQSLTSGGLVLAASYGLPFLASASPHALDLAAAGFGRVVPERSVAAWQSAMAEIAGGPEGLCRLAVDPTADAGVSVPAWSEVARATAAAYGR